MKVNNTLLNNTVVRGKHSREILKYFESAGHGGTTCSPSTQEVETRRLQVQGHLEQHIKF